MIEDIQQLRHLNFDDLFLMRALLAGQTVTEAAASLNISQPAASQRIRKIEALINAQFFIKQGRRAHLSSQGRDLCEQASAVLRILEQRIPKADAQRKIQIGTRAGVAQSWLSPALSLLRQQNPELTVHVVVGSGEEILRQLSSKRLDLVLTSAPVVMQGYSAIDIAREDYVLVAQPKLKAKIKSWEDLQNFVLIEHDRSFPFLRYLDDHSRLKFKFKDVWLTGSSEIMTQMAADGWGVAIVPLYLAKRHLESKRLQRLNLGQQLGHDWFRLIYSDDRSIDQEAKALAVQLKKVGLR